VTDVGTRAHRVVKWMPQVAATRVGQQPVDVPEFLEDIIPSDHPLRDILSPLEVKESPYFDVRDLAIIMGVPPITLYPRVHRGEIAYERHGAAVKIPREFKRLAALYLYQQAGTKHEVLTAVKEIEKMTRKLRQAVEPGA
jgi:hypothetical protein